MKLLEQIKEGIAEAITEAKLQGERSACYTHNVSCGYIDIWCDYNDCAEVVICQDDDKGIEHPNLEQAIYQVIPDWDTIEVEIDEDPYSDWVRFYGRI